MSFAQNCKKLRQGTLGGASGRAGWADTARGDVARHGRIRRLAWAYARAVCRRGEVAQPARLPKLSKTLLIHKVTSITLARYILRVKNCHEIKYVYIPYEFFTFIGLEHLLKASTISIL